MQTRQNGRHYAHVTNDEGFMIFLQYHIYQRKLGQNDFYSHNDNNNDDDDDDNDNNNNNRNDNNNNDNNVLLAEIRHCHAEFILTNIKFTFSQYWLAYWDTWNPSPWKTRSRLSCMIKSAADDSLATKDTATTYPGILRFLYQAEWRMYASANQPSLV